MSWFSNIDNACLLILLSHSTVNTRASLCYFTSYSNFSEPYYMLAIPFVHVNKSKLSRTEPPSGPIVALLAEEFYTFITTRPKFMIQKHSQVTNTSFIYEYIMAF